MAASDNPTENGDTNGPVIHDRRRIDPLTGQVRHGKHAASKPAGTTGAGRTGGASEPSDPAEPEATAPASEPKGAASSGQRSDERSVGATKEDEGLKRPEASELEAELAERTADLQRLQAEYANYRKRVERDRVTVKEQAVASTLTGLLPALDAIDRAREHGELSGGFKSVADSLQTALTRLGLITYGEKGDIFDPQIHEALTSIPSPDVTEDTCVEILQPGYKVGDRILRPARVAVAAPAEADSDSADSTEASWPSPDEEGN
jgi:molecular chaperone GrpE